RCARRRRPDVVVSATWPDDVVAVLALADEHRIPVTPFGAGSSLEGHVIPLDGGISLDLSRMDAVLAVDPADLTATAQPGVTRTSLERATAEHGLFFPVDPGADATLGGMAATNAAGTTSVRYGKMRANVLALEAVLPGGRVVRAGSRAPKTSAGYGLLGLLIGSEGTLGVITELTLRLHGIPEQAVVLRLAFPDVESACRAAATIVAAGRGERADRGQRRSWRRGPSSRASSSSTPGRSPPSTRTRGRPSPWDRRSSSKRPGRRRR